MSGPKDCEGKLCQTFYISLSFNTLITYFVTDPMCLDRTFEFEGKEIGSRDIGYSDVQTCQRFCQQFENCTNFSFTGYK